MKRMILITTLLAAGPFAYADILADGSLSFGVDSKALTVSSTTVSPTQILQHDSFITRTWIINTSTFTLLVSSFSHAFTPTAEVAIPPSTVFSPDGPMVPYWGPLFAVIVGTSTTSTGNEISILRTK